MSFLNKKKEKQKPKTVVYSEITKPESPAFRLMKKIMAFSFVVIFVGACIWQVTALRDQGQQMDQTIAELENQIEEEKGRQLEIKVEQEYYQSDQYKEQMARDRCKLIYPGELLTDIQQ